MDSQNVSSNKSGAVVYERALDYRDELLAIYIWPFILVLLCTIFGVVGNAIVLYIYGCRWIKTKTRIFFIMLGVLNLINSTINMPLEAYILWHPLNFDNHWMCKFSRGITFVINNVCACVFVAIAIDRLLLVYKPIKRRVLTARYAKIACLVAFIVGTATSWPGFVFYGTATLGEEVSGKFVMGKTCFLSDKFMIDSKWPKLFSIILFILMLVVFMMLIIMYIFIGKKIYSVTRNDSVGKHRDSTSSVMIFVRSLTIQRLFSSKRTNHAESTDSINSSPSLNNESTLKRKNIPRLGRRVSGTNLRASKDNTKTLLLVTIAYIVSFLPYVVIAIMRSKDAKFYSTMNKDSRIAYHVFLRFYFLNSVVNPFIYSFSNRQFRQKLILVFGDLRSRCKR